MGGTDRCVGGVVAGARCASARAPLVQQIGCYGETMVVGCSLHLFVQEYNETPVCLCVCECARVGVPTCVGVTTCVDGFSFDGRRCQGIKVKDVGVVRLVKDKMQLGEPVCVGGWVCRVAGGWLCQCRDGKLDGSRPSTV